MTDKQMDTKRAKSSAMTSVFLRFPRAMQEIALVSDFGCKKYAVEPSDMTYLETGTSQDYTDALGRHLVAESYSSPFNNEDGGVLHSAQVAWNALARLEKFLYDLENRSGVEERGDRKGSNPGTDF